MIIFFGDCSGVHINHLFLNPLPPYPIAFIAEQNYRKFLRFFSPPSKFPHYVKTSKNIKKIKSSPYAHLRQVSLNRLPWEHNLLHFDESYYTFPSATGMALIQRMVKNMCL